MVTVTNTHTHTRTVSAHLYSLSLLAGLDWKPAVFFVMKPTLQLMMISLDSNVLGNCGKIT